MPGHLGLAPRLKCQLGANWLTVPSKRVAGARVPDQVGTAHGEQDWYTLREVARALGLSRQAVHTRVRKGQLPAEQVDGIWRVSEFALAEAVQSQRRSVLALGTVRLLPAQTERGQDGGGDGLVDRVLVLEAAVSELSEEHRRALEQRDREVEVLKERCERLTKALHQMVDLLGPGAAPTD